MVVEWGNREGIERLGQQRERGSWTREREKEREWDKREGVSE